MNYFLCIPRGGFNDVCNIIWECYKYCKNYNRILIIDTRYVDTIRGDIRNYLIFSDPLVFNGDIDEIIKNKTVYPKELTKYLNDSLLYENLIYNYKNHKNICYYYDDILLTINLKIKYIEELIVYSYHSGGDGIVHIFNMVKFPNSLVKIISDRLKSLPEDYISVHIRNTDYKSNVKNFIDSNNKNFINKPIFLASDNYITIKSIKEKYKDNIYTFSNIPELNNNPIHRSDFSKFISSNDFITDIISDIILLIFGKEYYYSSKESRFSRNIILFRQNEEFMKKIDNLLSRKIIKDTNNFSTQNLNFYCINLKKSVNRKFKMEYRYNKANLIDKLKFVDAIDINNPIIEYYGEGIFNKYKITEVACFASHLKAIRTFLDETKEDIKWGIICEDDIMLIDNFMTHLSELMKNVPENTNLLSLGNLINNYNGVISSGIDKKKRNLFTIKKIDFWGAQMYMISREYAKIVIKEYDKPFRTIISEIILVSEILILNSNGLFSMIPLCIEDCSDSYIRDQVGMDFHANVLKRYKYTNYNKFELINCSPLANYTDVKHLLKNGIFIEIKNNHTTFKIIGKYDIRLKDDLEYYLDLFPDNLNIIFISNENFPIIKKGVIPNIPVLSKNISDTFSDIELPKDILKVIELIKNISYFQNFI